MPTTVAIAYEVSAASVAAIREMLEETAMRDIDWNGADFEIVRADYTSIDSDEHKAVTLLHEIFAIIDQSKAR